MTKLKLEDSIWKVLFESFKIYFKYIGTFTKYMLFPVFGQVLGLILLFGLTTWFTLSVPSLVVKFRIFDSLSVIILTAILLTIPGFIIFLKAFWDYLVAYGAINSMTSAILSTGKLYDLKAHTQVITKKSLKFIWLLCVISIMGLIAINPLFWVIGLIFFIYFVLVFQVFTFEEELSVFDCFKRSLNLIKGNFARTFVIMTILCVISYYLLSLALNFLFDLMRLSDILRGMFELWAMTLPLDSVNTTLMEFRLPAITALEIANQILSASILFIVAGLTLPMRSICWSLWYKNLSVVKDKKVDKK